MELIIILYKKNINNRSIYYHNINRSVLMKSTNIYYNRSIHHGGQ